MDSPHCTWLPQDNNELMGHGAVKAELSNRVPTSHAYNLAWAGLEFVKSKTLSQVNKRGVRSNTLTFYHVITDDKNRVASRAQHSPRLTKDSFQICKEACQLSSE
jgi:hypothetical protein